jgi:phosphoglycolate phosphatase-like HAD superfamily hydrolase
MLDFDGTVIDSMPFLESNAVFLLTTLYDFSEEEAQRKYRETTGLPFIQQMEIIAPNHSNSEIVEKFESMKIEKIYNQKPFSESFNVLRELKHRGYLLGISSGTIEKIIVEYLQKIELEKLVDDILGWKPGFEKGTDHFNFIKEKYRLSNENIVFIGDSLNDCIRAIENKICFYGKLGMFHKEDFIQINHDIKVIKSLTDILRELPPIGVF